MSLPRHPQYKDSGITWLGKVPAHWQVHRLKNLFEIRKRIVGEEGHQVLSITQRGIKVKDIESNDGQLSMDYSKYQIVHPGDFAMNHMDLLTGFVDISPYAGVTSPDYRVFAVRDGVLCEPRYFLYLLQNAYRQKIFYAFGQGASEFGRWRFPTDQFNDFRFPYPPPGEQAAIATFLDNETGKIDALIAEQEKLLALLAEKRQATISYAVTKGLNPDAPMKGSGVSWLGEVPAQWSIRKLGHVSFMQEGPGLRHWQFTSDGVKVICVTNITEFGIDFSRLEKFISSEEYESTYKHFTVNFGDLLLSSSGNSWGKVASFESSETVILNTSTIRINPGNSNALIQAYIKYALQSRNVREQLSLFMTGSCQPNFGPTHLSQVLIAVPSVSEQSEIASFLDEEVARIDTLTAEATSGIALLKERRSALVSAAVTGQIDVRSLVTEPETA